MRFKARLKSGEYLGDNEFLITAQGEILSKNTAGVMIRLDAELLPIVETKSFCKFCGARGKHG